MTKNKKWLYVKVFLSSLIVISFFLIISNKIKSEIKTETIYVNAEKNYCKTDVTEIDIQGLFGETLSGPEYERQQRELELRRKQELELQKNSEKNNIDILKNKNNNNQNENLNISETKEETLRDNELDSIIPDDTKAELLDVKKKTDKEYNRYKEEYNGSTVYALVAFMLNRLRLASIPITAVAIIVSVVYQYILGLNTREVWNKGYKLRRVAITFFIIAQVLPFLFAVIVKGWGI